MQHESSPKILTRNGSRKGSTPPQPKNSHKKWHKKREHSQGGNHYLAIGTTVGGGSGPRWKQRTLSGRSCSPKSLPQHHPQPIRLSQVSQGNTLHLPGDFTHRSPRCTVTHGKSYSCFRMQPFHRALLLPQMSTTSKTPLPRNEGQHEKQTPSRHIQ